MTREFFFGNRKIGANEKTFIIAEISSNHLQDFNTAKELVRASCNSGVDAIKLQTYTPDSITLNSSNINHKIKDKYFIVQSDNKDWNNRTYYDLYSKGYMPWEWYDSLKNIAREHNVETFSTPYDLKAVDFLEKAGVSAYKVSSFDIINIPLLRKIASTKKPVIMSVGMATLNEITEAYNVLKEYGCPDIALLHCISSYPAEYNQLKLSNISDLQKRFDCIIGFSDHSLTTNASAIAVSLGAKIIEKHITLDRKNKGIDSSFSLEPHEFKELVMKIRKVENKALSPDQLKMMFPNMNETIGIPSYRATNKEILSARPSIWISADIKKGDILTSRNIRVARPSGGILPKHLYSILGRKVNKNLGRGTPMLFKYLIE